MNSITGARHFFGEFPLANFSGVGRNVVSVVTVAGGNDESELFTLTGSSTKMRRWKIAPTVNIVDTMKLPK